jgi:large subunit ribosomal protein L32e
VAWLTSRPPKVRRKYRGYDISPHIGYGTRADLRHGSHIVVSIIHPLSCGLVVLPNGFKKFTINNVAELDLLLMQNREYCAEIAHNVSQRKRAQIIERAKVLDVKVPKLGLCLSPVAL